MIHTDQFFEADGSLIPDDDDGVQAEIDFAAFSGAKNATELIISITCVVDKNTESTRSSLRHFECDRSPVI